MSSKHLLDNDGVILCKHSLNLSQKETTTIQKTPISIKVTTNSPKRGEEKIKHQEKAKKQVELGATLNPVNSRNYHTLIARDMKGEDEKEFCGNMPK